MIYALSYLLPYSEILEGVEGYCVLCGRYTESGKRFQYSSNFTAFSNLQYGDVLCAACSNFFTNQEFRRKSWIIEKQQVTFLKRVEILDVLVREREPPFAIYVSSTGQRQGWLQGFRYVSYSNQHFFVHTDFVGCVEVRYQDLVERLEVLKKLREYKVSKTELLQGFSMHTYRKAVENGYEHLLKQCEKYVKHSLWEVLVYVI